jgi:Arc/MetJ-type ribon-helix-helix transcriptional regulator
MSATVELPDEIVEFVRSEVARGTANDESELVTRAVALYREMAVRHVDLVGHVQNALEQGRKGDTAPFDIEEIIAELAIS